MKTESASEDELLGQSEEDEIPSYQPQSETLQYRARARIRADNDYIFFVEHKPNSITRIGKKLKRLTRTRERLKRARKQAQYPGVNGYR